MGRATYQASGLLPRIVETKDWLGRAPDCSANPGQWGSPGARMVHNCSSPLGCNE